jgi:hypothetical protein
MCIVLSTDDWQTKCERERMESDGLKKKYSETNISRAFNPRKIEHFSAHVHFGCIGVLLSNPLVLTLLASPISSNQVK